MRRLLNALGSLLVLAAAALGAYELDRRERVLVAGSATATDGDSLRINGTAIRLEGLDAPELKQTCQDAEDRSYNCGEAARALLRERVALGPVRCTVIGRDRYGRSLAHCDDGAGEDLGTVLVGRGFAVGYGRSRRYAAAEDAARRRKLGLWAGRFETPAEYRKARAPHRGEIAGDLSGEVNGELPD